MQHDCQQCALELTQTWQNALRADGAPRALSAPEHARAGPERLATAPASRPWPRCWMLTNRA